MLTTSMSEIKRPSVTLLATEPWRAAYEFVSHAFAPKPETSPGDGHPVMIFPGLAADSSTIAPLRRFCQSLGYTACDWGQGRNFGPKGDVDEWMEKLVGRISESLSVYDRSASLIGWSLGGIYAREVAKRLHPQVRQVITIGTPFNSTADRTNVGWLYRLLSGNRAAFDAELSAKLRSPPPVPTTSIYSRSDGIVAWQSCLHEGESSQYVQDIEIDGSHIGMVWNRAALAVIADRLALPPGEWLPYSADLTSASACTVHAPRQRCTSSA